MGGQVKIGETRRGFNAINEKKYCKNKKGGDEILAGCKKTLKTMADETPEEHPGGSESPEGEASPSVLPTNSNGEDNKNDGNDKTSRESSTGRCLSALISSVIQDFDNRAEDTLGSQDQLSFALNRLTGELDQLLDDAPLPFVMQHAARISGVRKRVTSLNSVLKSIQRRVDNIDRMLSAGSLQEKIPTESMGTH